MSTHQQTKDAKTVVAVCIFLVFCWSFCPTKGKAMRIVSLAPSLTKNLLYLEAEKDLIGCTSYCKTTQKKEVVASAIQVNTEKVLSLKPDLVVTTTLTNKNAIETLRKMGIKVVVYPTARSFEEVCTQFLDLGKRLGKLKLAEKTICESREKVERLKATSNRVFKVFFQIGANPLFAVVPKTFMDDYITFIGGKNTASGLTTGIVTREAVLARNPDVIFIASMGITGVAEKRRWEQVTTLNAVKNKHIFVVDSNTACTPCPVCFVKTLEEMVRLLQSSTTKTRQSAAT